MKILQVHARYRGRGGEDTTVANEHDLLADAGHSVRLLEGWNSLSAAGAARQLGRSAWNTAAARRLGSAIDGFAPDVVHVHNTWFAHSPAVLAKASRLGVPVVMTLQNYRLVCVSANLFRDGALCEDCVGHGPWRGVQHRCYRGSAVASGVLAANIAAHRRLGTWHRWVDRFIAVSDFGVERHVAGGVPRERIIVKDNFALDPGPRSAPPSASDEVLFVGRDAPEKGLHALLANWRAAAPPGLHLAVIGDVAPPSTPAGAEAVKFLAGRDRAAVKARMKSARALVIPSEWPEGQPLALLEALAAGLPVVGSDIGGIAEVIGDSEGPWRVPVGANEQWRRALRKLADPDEVNRAGQESRRLYERRFGPDDALDALERVYRAAIDRRDGIPLGAKRPGRRASGVPPIRGSRPRMRP